MSLMLFTLATATVSFSQPPPPDPQQQPYVFRVDVVSRTTKAINFHHRQGWTVLGLEGSSLAPRARGEIRVDSKTGATKVEVSLERIEPANLIDEGFLTYVLWAITPEGRAENLGELMLEGNHARVQAATELQTFGLIVTAEPYYAVTQPSDAVVAEGVIRRNETTGTFMPIDTKYELVKRGGYLQQLPPGDRVRLREARNIPLDLMEARQAMAVAHAAGAPRYAASTWQKAEIDLRNAEGFLHSNQDRKKIQTLARHVTQLAEDARLISVRRAEEDALANERAQSERRANELTRNAELEAQRRKTAEFEAAQRSQEAANARRAAEQVQAQTNAALAAKDRQMALDAERARLEAARVDAERARFESEAVKSRAQAEEAAARQRASEEEARRARETAARADEERARMRAELVRQFNIVLATRETARGLIVNMSDVLFDTGLYTLKPGTREKLAKISGIILAHPGLKIEVEGHTDSVGGDEYNQRLSEQRAAAVRTYLVTQGVGSDTITSRGFGKTRPVADNATAAGRQVNRRVELVVNGAMLGNPSGPNSDFGR